MIGQVTSVYFRDKPFAEESFHDTVMIKHGVTISGNPHVAFQAGGAKAER